MYKKNIAVIGCGTWGKNLVRNFSQLGSLKGVYDANQEQYAKNKIAEDIHRYASLEEIKKDTEIEGVVIAAQPEHHYDLGMEFLEAGKHIFVEKPITLSYSTAKKLVRKAEEENKVLLVGHILEYHPAVIKLRSIIRGGGIGKIKEIYSHRLNTGTVRQIENVWWSFAPHDILLILNTVRDRIRSLNCVASDYMDRGVHDSTMTTFKFKNGVFGHIYVSWAHPFKEQSFIVVGTGGAIEFNDTREKEKLRIYNHRFTHTKDKGLDIIKGDYSIIDFDSTEPLREECKDFIDCIDSGDKPKSSGHDGLKVVEILEQATSELQ